MCVFIHEPSQKAVWMSISRRHFLSALLGSVSLASTAPFVSAGVQTIRFLRGDERLRNVGLFNPFGYGIASGGSYLSKPYIVGFPSWQNAVPTSLLKALHNAGVTALRLCVDPGPLLAAQSNMDLDNLLAPIANCISAIVDAELRCYVDMHVEPAWFVAVKGWGDTDVIDGPTGPRFQRLVFVERRLAALLSRSFRPSDVGFELFNEPPQFSDFNGKTAWTVQLKYLFDSVRSVAPELTLIIAGAGFGGVSGLITLDPSLFDANTMFSFHSYEPYTFTFQSLTGQWIGGWCHLPYIKRLPFPPDKGVKAAAMKDMAAAVNADDNLTWLQKLKCISSGGAALDAYFDYPQGGSFIASFIRRAVEWADKNEIARNRILLGEFGAWGDAAVGADEASKVNYYTTVVREAENAGIGWCVHDLEESQLEIYDHRWHAAPRRSLQNSIEIELILGTPLSQMRQIRFPTARSNYVCRSIHSHVRATPLKSDTRGVQPKASRARLTSRTTACGSKARAGLWSRQIDRFVTD